MKTNNQLPTWFEDKTVSNLYFDDYTNNINEKILNRPRVTFHVVCTNKLFHC